jgi:alpha-galactosidase
MRIALAATAAALLLPAPAAAALAPTPPMGWSSWNHFGCRIDERTVRETADALVSSGMRDAGYRYVNVDDCWMAPTRDPSGGLLANPGSFPSGIPSLAKYLHARALRLGLYTSIGAQTCQGLPGLAGHESGDLARIAAWGADYLKVDFCGASEAVRKNPAAAYARVRDGLAAGGRSVVLGISTWGQGEPWRWRPRVGQTWRVSGDIEPSWRSILHNAGRSASHAAAAGPGGWNDPDSLEVGNRGLSIREQRAHFGLWAMLAAPLIAGNDIRTMSRSTRRILLNRELIAVDQDRLGSQGRRVRRGRREVWLRRLAHGARALLLLNRGRRTAVIGYRLGSGRRYRVRDLWRHRSRSSGPLLHARVPGHGAALFRVVRRSR